MDLQGERLIPATIERTWDALNDPAMLQVSVPGCESLTRHDDGSFDAVVAVRIGPVNARFKGKLELADVQPLRSYTLRFEGQGGVAGFGKGSADVELLPQDDGTRLVYRARAQVGGKVAQIGSRLVDAAASKLVAKFFDAFEAQLRPSPPGDAEPAPVASG